MTDSTDTRRPERHQAQPVHLGPRDSDTALIRFLLEERSRRSIGLTGYLVSAAGAGAVSCWFAINSLYASKAPVLVLRLLLAATGLMLVAATVGFVAALAGYKAFDGAASLASGGVSRSIIRPGRWLTVIPHARAATGVLIAIGGAVAFAAYLLLCWD